MSSEPMTREEAEDLGWSIMSAEEAAESPIILADSEYELRFSLDDSTIFRVRAPWTKKGLRKLKQYMVDDGVLANGLTAELEKFSGKDAPDA